uniref:TIA1 cytotoxic granule associated RNA binding protein n=1 Tax=Rousettus aegyptiacus TaxID=9407 RepID=A0A7J8FN21_ROUAE|nr:TIA1 cytotoxic granule associated RNA binding protein [Rousettus aegyptiacus]
MASGDSGMEMHNKLASICLMVGKYLHMECMARHGTSRDLIRHSLLHHGWDQIMEYSRLQDRMAACCLISLQGIVWQGMKPSEKGLQNLSQWLEATWSTAKISA